MGDLQGENIYDWYLDKIKEDIGVSQFRYLKSRILEMLDILVILGKHIDVMESELKYK